MITSDTFVKFLVGQMLDQLRKHGAARVHPAFLSLPFAAQVTHPDSAEAGSLFP